MVCPCEDVTEAEVREAIEEGYADLESLKRYTALATGPCQGKACLVLARRILADETDTDPADLGTISYRPPTQPVRLADLADDDAPGADG
jgi:bacterioferritin-associated ferredoxin